MTRKHYDKIMDEIKTIPLTVRCMELREPNKLCVLCTESKIHLFILFEGNRLNSK